MNLRELAVEMLREMGDDDPIVDNIDYVERMLNKMWDGGYDAGLDEGRAQRRAGEDVW